MARNLAACALFLFPLLLQLDSTRSEVFRGLGGAYQSQGQHQMAFASYQQAINLAPWDLLAYLKLGMLYEDLVSDGARHGVELARTFGRRVRDFVPELEKREVDSLYVIR